eukprot:TRINITY_DN16579_c0_g1_i1.p2 TRINITY_DN16579_c0_g1~~TRINITY_DN16579_c0_g1_i1.p2  ORF type:complete len:147 (+),score=19.31 TRINITY_DN16579_c0_g1_i1:252-692(+)
MSGCLCRVSCYDSVLLKRKHNQSPEGAVDTVILHGARAAVADHLRRAAEAVSWALKDAARTVRLPHVYSAAREVRLASDAVAAAIAAGFGTIPGITDAAQRSLTEVLETTARTCRAALQVMLVFAFAAVLLSLAALAMAVGMLTAC